MAYLDFSAVDGAPASPAFHAQITAVPEDFSSLEWTVIEIARHDPPSTLRAPGRLAATLAKVLGRTVALPLADPKLEALRRFAVFAWRHGYVLPASEISRFLAAGFSSEQAETLIGHAVFASVRPDRRTAA